MPLTNLHNGLYENRNDIEREDKTRNASGDQSGDRRARVHSEEIQSGIKANGEHGTEKDPLRRNFGRAQVSYERINEKRQQRTKVDRGTSNADGELVSRQMNGPIIYLVTNTREELVKSLGDIVKSGRAAKEWCREDESAPQENEREKCDVRTSGKHPSTKKVGA